MSCRLLTITLAIIVVEKEIYIKKKYLSVFVEANNQEQQKVIVLSCITGFHLMGVCYLSEFQGRKDNAVLEHLFFPTARIVFFFSSNFSAVNGILILCAVSF